MALANITHIEGALHSSQLSAVLAPCALGAVVVLVLVLAFAVAGRRERQQMEGAFGRRRRQAPGDPTSAARQQGGAINTVEARVERLV